MFLKKKKSKPEINPQDKARTLAPKEEVELAPATSKKTPAERSYRLLVYGADRLHINIETIKLDNRNFSLNFEPYNTTKRFDDYDGVITFQGIFETYKRTQGGVYGSMYTAHSYDKDELDKRHKELERLLNNGGFVCFVLHGPFRDRVEGKNYTGTDLCKIALNIADLYREDLSKRTPRAEAYYGELQRFCELYGAARTTFRYHGDALDMRPLVKAEHSVTGMSLNGKAFFIPSLIPEPHHVDEYFHELANALVAIRNKFITDIPAWIDQFKFHKEEKAHSRISEIETEIENLTAQITKYKNFKRVLISNSDALVEEVAHMLEKGYGLNIDKTDEYREDLKILNDESMPLVFVEVKGTNSGVKREYINQADSHRERADLVADFPIVLIVNTHIKNARTIDEKDQAVPSEQIRHAKKIGVLIVRTIDLLRLLRLVELDAISKEDVLKIFQTETGWLRCEDDSFEIVSG